jgi:toxin ParE1/3/4
VNIWKLTLQARADLAEILRYTTDTWGSAQADEYLIRILHGLDLIAQTPVIGRRCETLAPKLLRLVHSRHVIFYKPQKYGILVTRILHQSSLPTRPQFMGE